jgi:hypothetical protein
MDEANCDCFAFVLLGASVLKCFFCLYVYTIIKNLLKDQQQFVPNLLPNAGCIKLIVEPGLRV